MRLYDNSRTVADEAAILANFQLRSRQIYAPMRHQQLAYGQHPRQVCDYFDCGRSNAPIVVFVHGGYWQWCDNRDFGFVVPDLLQAGVDVVLLEYPLTPDVAFAALCDSVGLALDHLSAQAHLQQRTVYLCGHSAGGHLSALHQHHPWVDVVCAISGIYDLAPLQDTHLNEALQLSAQDIANLSPIHLPASNKPVHLVCGGMELPELQWQTDHYAAAIAQQTHHVTLTHLAACNHYSILDAVFEADGYFLRHVLC